MKIKELTNAEVDSLFASEDLGKFEPIGLFYEKVENKYIGIDNSTGDAWTEEFDSLEKCERWLKGGTR